VRVGEPICLDTLKEPPEGRGIGHIRRIRLTRTAGKHTTNTTTDISDCRARITRFRKDFRLAVVVDYRPLYGSLVDGHVDEVVTNDGENPVRTADGGASGINMHRGPFYCPESRHRAWLG